MQTSWWNRASSCGQASMQYTYKPSLWLKPKTIDYELKGTIGDWQEKSISVTTSPSRHCRAESVRPGGSADCRRYWLDFSQDRFFRVSSLWSAFHRHQKFSWLFLRITVPLRSDFSRTPDTYRLNPRTSIIEKSLHIEVQEPVFISLPIPSRIRRERMDVIKT